MSINAEEALVASRFQPFYKFSSCVTIPSYLVRIGPGQENKLSHQPPLENLRAAPALMHVG